jgi:hypothetical protein
LYNSGGEPQLKIGDIKYHTETVATLGGPIIKEKLFFFLAGGFTGEKHKLYEAPNYSTKKQPHFQGRLDWRVTKNNSVALMFNSDPLDHDNLGLMSGSGPEIAISHLFRSQSVYGSWTSVIKNDTVFNVKYAGFRGKDKEVPVVLDTPSVYSLVTARRYGSGGWALVGDRNRDQLNATLTHYADSFLGASHEIDLGFEYERSSAREHDFAAGNVAASIWPGPNETYSAYATVNYVYDGTPKLRSINGFIQDNVKIGSKLTLNLGVRYENPKLTAVAASGGTPTKLMNVNRIDPRLGFSYDIGGDAKNVVHLSYGRYHQKVGSSAFDGAMPGQQKVDFYEWSMAAHPDLSTPEAISSFIDSLVQPEHYSWSWGGPDLIPVADDIDTPYTDVFNAGFERQLSRDVVLSIEFIHKRDRNFIIQDTLTPHTYEEVQWTDPYLGRTIPVWVQTDENFFDEAIIRNSTLGKKNHNFLTVSLRKRDTGKWSMTASYTYQRSVGNVNNWDEDAVGGYFNTNIDTDPNYLQNPMRWGLLDFNRTHQVKMTGSYLLPWGLVFSGDLHLMSGRRWTPQISYDYTPAGYKFGMQAFLEDRGSRQMPMKKILNVRLSKQFGLGGSSTLELSLDALNVFNDPDATHYFTEPYDVYAVTANSAFGKPWWIGSPRRLQAGFRWKF